MKVKLSKIVLDKIVEEFGIDPNAECYPNSTFFKGTPFSKKEICEKLKSLNIRGFVVLFGLPTFWDKDSYYRAYHFEKIGDRYRLHWFDRTETPR